MLPIWALVAGSARAQVPPPITDPSGGTFAALYDIATPLVNGGAVVAGLLACVVAFVLHRAAVASAASAWQGNTISWGKVWLMPLVGAAGTVFLVAAGLVGLGLADRDLLTLLLIDWQQPLGVGLWLAALIGGVAGPPVVAQITTGRTPQASIKG